MYWEKEVCVYLKLRLYCLWCARCAQSFFIGSCIIVVFRASVLGPCFASTANKETSVLTWSLNECTVLNTLKASRQQWLLLVRRKALKALKASRFGSFFFGSAFGALMNSELIFAFRRTIRRVNPFVGGVTCGNYRVVVAPVWVVRARHCREKGQTVPSLAIFGDFLKPDHRAPKNPLSNPI
mgnify:CR=1 FL=1